MEKSGLKQCLFALMVVVAAGAAGFSGTRGTVALDDQKPPVLNGDTSIPDEELVKLYGDRVPSEVLLMAHSDKLPPVLFRHEKHVGMKLARCANCHHADPKDIKQCSACHTPKPEDEKVKKYREAYKGLCLPCHQAKNAGGEVPPVKRGPGKTIFLVPAVAAFLAGTAWQLVPLAAVLLYLRDAGRGAGPTAPHRWLAARLGAWFGGD